MTSEGGMEKLELGDAETTSADVVAEDIEGLRALFPEAFVEGKIDFETLKQLLGGAVDEREEKYGLNWHGKRRARQLALTPSTGTLRPAPDESVDWDTTQNLMIEGDNLEVLKLLQKSYAGKVKLIYIDPPYNTGKDFVYPDDFRDNIRNYLELTGQVNGGIKITSNPESSGRFHTDWLSMMYPRLKLARQLLREDGLLFVTIDDGEVYNLRLLLNELFGEENFVGNAVWEKAYTANMTAEFISATHDHVVIYARDANAAEIQGVERTDEQIAKFRNPDNDPRGAWKAENLSAGKFYSAGQFSIRGPSGKSFDPPPGRYWRCNAQQYQKWLADGRITFGSEGDGRPMLKKYLSESSGKLTPSTWWHHKAFGSNKEASIELKQLFDGEMVFQTPKPVKLLRRMLELATQGGDLVLDFFAGSGTTGHAVAEQNSTDASHRRFILVQMPEVMTDPRWKSLSDVTKERLRRAVKKVKADNPLFAGDLGFRVFKLDSSNIRAWEPRRDDLEQTVIESEEHIKSGRSEQDILYELLLKLRLELTVPIETRPIAGKAVHSIGGGVLTVCLAESVSAEEVEGLANGIVAWHKELAPAGEVQLVFRDSAFADDVAKTNLTAILQQQGLGNVKSV